MPQIWGNSKFLIQFLEGKINSKEAIIIQEHAYAIGEHKNILFFPGLGLRKKLFEIYVFSDFKIAPDLGQFPRSEGFFFKNYILPQIWGKSPVLGKIQLSKVQISCAGGNSTIKSVNTQTNYTW